MAFASTVTRVNPAAMGDRRVTWGTFTNGGSDTGGNIDTGLRYVTSMFLQHTGAAAIASAPSINEIMPCDGSAVTIVTTADADGIWMAFGE